MVLSNNNPALDQVIDAMLKVLKDYLPLSRCGGGKRERR